MDGYCTNAALDAIPEWEPGTIAMGIALWSVTAAAAWMVAPADRRWTFFWITLSILGPLGVLGAAVASPRKPTPCAPMERPAAPNRTRFTCTRCTATTDLIITDPDEDVSCWRCGDPRLVAREWGSAPGGA